MNSQDHSLKVMKMSGNENLFLKDPINFSDKIIEKEN